MMSKQFKKRRKLKQRKCYARTVELLLESIQVGDTLIISAHRTRGKKVSIRLSTNGNYWGWVWQDIPTKVSEPDQLMLVEAYPQIGKFLKLTPKALQLYNMLEII